MAAERAEDLRNIKAVICSVSAEWILRRISHKFKKNIRDRVESRRASYRSDTTWNFSE